MKFPRVLVSGLTMAGSVLFLSAISACSGSNEAASVSHPAPAVAHEGGTLPAGLKPVASIIDLMDDLVDPTSKAVWAEGDPKTDAEWAARRSQALMLMEAANLLATEGRVVARPGQTLREPGGQGDYTPAQAQDAIEKNRAAFTAMSAAMQNATQTVIDAIDKKDANAYLEAGGAIDEACEACHTRFWYPNAAKAAGG